jgi:hypothetical protein
VTYRPGDVRGDPVFIGDRTVTPIARRRGVRVRIGPGGVFGLYDRAAALEIESPEGERRVLTIPDRELQIRLLVAAIVALALIIQRRRNQR